MKERKVYFIHWNNRRLFLNDRYGKTDLMNHLEEENIRGYYGSAPGTEEMAGFQTELQVKADMAVNRWINDSRFIIHFLMATGIFLVSFYFLSYVIQDPLPLVDEIVISLVLGFLGWHRLNNQNIQSEKANRKKLELKQLISRIPFEQSEFLNQVELYLEKISDMKEGEVRTMLQEGSVPLFFTTSGSELMDFHQCLASSLGKSRRAFPFFSGKTKKKENSPAESGELLILSRQLSDYYKNQG